MRDTERVTRLARGDHRLRRAARALGVRALGIEPEAQRHADRVRQRAQESNGAVDAAAHRDDDAARRVRCAKRRADRIRKRVSGKRLPADRGRLQQRQPNKRPVEPSSIRLDDAIVFDRQSNKSELRATSGISKKLCHEFRLAIFPASAGSASARLPALSSAQKHHGAKRRFL